MKQQLGPTGPGRERLRGRFSQPRTWVVAILSRQESLPAPPIRRSMPGPPIRVSFPLPPLMTSAPPRPEILSGPPPPQITSDPSVPRSTSAPGPPGIVHRGAAPALTGRVSSATAAMIVNPRPLRTRVRVQGRVLPTPSWRASGTGFHKTGLSGVGVSPGQLKGLVAATFKSKCRHGGRSGGFAPGSASISRRSSKGERSSSPDGEGASLASAGSVAITSSILCAGT